MMAKIYHKEIIVCMLLKMQLKILEEIKEEIY